jgi:two-component system copper resistance phosphate regulon response regulator CusR
MRVLIVDDERKTTLYLAKGLTSSGYTVDTAADGQEGLFLASEYSYDLIILDIMLPKLDGWTVISELRRTYPNMRILFLSARDSVTDKVKGFELGADDYLVKPFAFSELLGRVKALLRREVSPVSKSIAVADLHIDLIKHKVTRNNQLIELTAQEFKLLVFLSENPSVVLTRTIIAESVWDINFNTDTNVIDVAIRRLRQKIDSPFGKSLIHTVRGIGYVFEER